MKDDYTEHDHTHRRASDPVVITTREVYDVVLETRTSVDSLLLLHTAADKRATDHEQRIRDLEKWRYALPTALVLGAFSSLAVIARVLLEGFQQ